MKVHELIVKLQEIDPEAEIFTANDGEDWQEDQLTWMNGNNYFLVINPNVYGENYKQLSNYWEKEKRKLLDERIESNRKNK